MISNNNVLTCSFACFPVQHLLDLHVFIMRHQKKVSELSRPSHFILASLSTNYLLIKSFDFSIGCKINNIGIEIGKETAQRNITQAFRREKHFKTKLSFSKTELSKMYN